MLVPEEVRQHLVFEFLGLFYQDLGGAVPGHVVAELFLLSREREYL